MMISTRSRKLTLSIETLRNLSDAQARRIVGGDTDTFCDQMSCDGMQTCEDTCPNTVCGTGEPCTGSTSLFPSDCLTCG